PGERKAQTRQTRENVSWGMLFLISINNCRLRMEAWRFYLLSGKDPDGDPVIDRHQDFLQLVTVFFDSHQQVACEDKRGVVTGANKLIASRFLLLFKNHRFFFLRKDGLTQRIVCAGRAQQE